MTLCEMTANPRFQFICCLRIWNSIREENRVNFGRGIKAGTLDDDAAVVFFPFEYGTRADTQDLPDFCRNRDLPLGGYF